MKRQKKNERMREYRKRKREQAMAAATHIQEPEEIFHAQQVEVEIPFLQQVPLSNVSF